MDKLLLASLPEELAATLEAGYRMWQDGALGAARVQLEEALERAAALGSVTGQLSAIHLLGNLAFDRGDLRECRELHEIALAECRARRIGVGVASSLHNLGLLSAREGDGEAARRLISEAINTYEQIGRRDAAGRARASLRKLVAGELHYP